jgi:putative component of toxin-antitoxin plasmid stabilization module
VKKPIEITLSAIHVGSSREVVTLAIDGKSPAAKFLTQLQKKDRNAYKTLKTRIRTVAEYEHYENDESFRHVGDGVYEFKRNNPRLLRLYAFYDNVDGIGRLILCTNGGDKTSQDQDILKAKAIKERYFDAKQRPDTKLIHEEQSS